jgi:hypothetical protein
LSALSTAHGSASAPTSFTLKGNFLAGAPGNLTVTPPAGFEVSLSSGSGYSTSLSVPYANPMVSNIVYVRLAANAADGSYSGNITVSGGGATSQNIATVTSSVTNIVPTVGNVSYSRASGLPYMISITNLMSNVSDGNVGDVVYFVGYSSTNGSVTADANYIYVPGNTVTETLTYQARDDFGGTNSGTITITINGAVYSTTNGNVSPTSTNATARLFGIPGFTYSAQRGTNSIFTLGVTNFPSQQAGTNGVITISDDFGDLFGTPNSEVPGEAYYRLKYESQP